jgi:phage-related protein
MTTIGEAYVKIRPDSKGFESEVKKGVSGGIAAAAKVAAGILGTVGVASFLKSSINEAREANKISAQTEAVIKSMGGAAKVSGKDVDKLAGSLSNYAGIDDDVIQKGANLILTFGNIRNEAGKNNKIFDQATKAAIDLSAAGFGSIEGASIQLGKALNDPIKGIASLGKSGVTFSEDQKAAIKSMVESNDLLGAQKIILAEVNKQVAGSAAAQADPLQRLGVAWGNLKEQIGSAILPILAKLATSLADKLPGALAALGSAFSRVADIVGPYLKTLVLGLKALVSAFKEGDVTSDGFVGVMERLGNALRKVADLVKDATNSVVAFVKKNPRPVLAALAVVIGAALVPAVGALATSLAASAAAMIALLSPVYAVVAVLAAAAAGAVYAYDNFEGFREVVDKVAKFIKKDLVPALKEAWHLLQDNFVPAVLKVKTAIFDAADAIQDFWLAIANSYIVGQLVDGFKSLAEKAVVLAGVFNEYVFPAIAKVFDYLKTIVGVALLPFIAAWKVFGDSIVEIVKTTFGYVVNLIQIPLDIILHLFGFFFDLFTGRWSQLGDDINQLVISTMNRVVDTFTELFTGIGNVFTAGKEGVTNAWSSIWDGIKNVANDAKNWIIDNVINPVIDGLNLIKPGDDINRLSTTNDSGSKGAPDSRGEFNPRNYKRRAFGGLTKGLTLVGERGPELISVGKTSRVTPNHELGGKTYALTINNTGNVDSNDLSRWLSTMGFLYG